MRIHDEAGDKVHDKEMTHIHRSHNRRREKEGKRMISGYIKERTLEKDMLLGEQIIAEVDRGEVMLYAVCIRYVR